MKNKALFLYILFMFLVTGIAPFLSEIAVGIYLLSAIVLAGIVAIVLQKRIHHGKIVKMGFRLNRNALIGIGIGMLFTMAFVFINYGLPYYLGVERFTLNEESLSAAANLPPLDTVLILIVIGTIYFLAALFGEELAFRGYILYFIFPNPDYGIASKYAIYHVIIMNNSAATAIQWGWPIFSIFLMLGLCRIVKK